MDELTPEATQERRLDWKNRVKSLMDSILAWAEEQGWQCSQTEVEIHEELLGTYALPQLKVLLPDQRSSVLVRPVGLHIVGGNGRIDIESWPSLNRFKLIGRPDGWELYTDSNIRWPKVWNKETCVELIRELANDHAA